MSVCLPLGKGCCADPDLLQLRRRSFALQLVTNSRITARCLPSEWNPTDHASLVLEKGTPAPSHILQALPRCRDGRSSALVAAGGGTAFAEAGARDPELARASDASSSGAPCTVGADQASEASGDGYETAHSSSERSDF